MPSSTIARDRFVVASRCANVVAGAGIGVVVRRHVDRLHRRNRALLGRCDALLQLAHLGAERRLVTDGRRHAPEERRHFGPRLRETEDVVDEEQHVLAFGIAEVLRDRQARQRHAKTGARRLRHLSVHQRGARLRQVVLVDDAALLELEPQIVAFAGALADAGKHRHAAVLHRDVVDQLLDDDGLADAGAAEQPDLAAEQVRLEQVDDLDAGLEHLQLGRLLLQRRGAAMDRPSLFRVHRTVRIVDRLAEHVHHAAERGGPDRHRDWLAQVDRLHPALHAVGRLHRDRAHPRLAEVLLDLADDVDLRLARFSFGLDLNGVIDVRQVAVGKLDVDDRTDDLNDLADLLLRCDFSCHSFLQISPQCTIRLRHRRVVAVRHR